MYTHIQVYGLLHSNKNGWNLSTCDNINGPGGNYAKWNKSDGERQIFVLISLWESRKQNKWTNQIKQTCRYREHSRG